MRSRKDPEIIEEEDDLNIDGVSYQESLRNSKLKTGRILKKSSARKDVAFKSTREKRRLYFCCIGTEIDTDKMKLGINSNPYFQSMNLEAQLIHDVIHISNPLLPQEMEELSRFRRVPSSEYDDSPYEKNSFPHSTLESDHSPPPEFSHSSTPTAVHSSIHSKFPSLSVDQTQSRSHILSSESAPSSPRPRLPLTPHPRKQTTSSSSPTITTPHSTTNQKNDFLDEDNDKLVMDEGVGEEGLEEEGEGGGQVEGEVEESSKNSEEALTPHPFSSMSTASLWSSPHDVSPVSYPRQMSTSLTAPSSSSSKSVNSSVFSFHLDSPSTSFSHPSSASPNEDLSLSPTSPYYPSSSTSSSSSSSSDSVSHSSHSSHSVPLLPPSPLPHLHLPISVSTSHSPKSSSLSSSISSSSPRPSLSLSLPPPILDQTSSPSTPLTPHPPFTSTSSSSPSSSSSTNTSSFPSYSLFPPHSHAFYRTESLESQLSTSSYYTETSSTSSDISSPSPLPPLSPPLTPTSSSSSSSFSSSSSLSSIHQTHQGKLELTELGRGIGVGGVGVPVLYPLKEIFLFDFGAAVFWGYSRAQEQEILAVLTEIGTRPQIDQQRNNNNNNNNKNNNNKNINTNQSSFTHIMSKEEEEEGNNNNKKKIEKFVDSTSDDVLNIELSTTTKEPLLTSPSPLKNTLSSFAQSFSSSSSSSYSSSFSSSKKGYVSIPDVEEDEQQQQGEAQEEDFDELDDDIEDGALDTEQTPLNSSRFSSSSSSSSSTLSSSSSSSCYQDPPPPLIVETKQSKRLRLQQQKLNQQEKDLELALSLKGSLSIKGEEDTSSSSSSSSSFSSSSKKQETTQNKTTHSSPFSFPSPSPSLSSSSSFLLAMPRGLLSSEEFQASQDDMTFVLSTLESEVSVANEVFCLPLFSSVRIRLSISFAIAQSAVLSLFENRVAHIIEDCREIPQTLSLKGRFPLSSQEISIKFGQIFRVRHDVNLHSEILDTPDFFWNREDEIHLQLYHLTWNYFEMETRTNLINTRLNMIQELMEVLLKQHEFTHSVKLDWIVIWLIVIYCVLDIFEIWFVP